MLNCCSGEEIHYENAHRKLNAPRVTVNKDCWVVDQDAYAGRNQNKLVGSGEHLKVVAG